MSSGSFLAGVVVGVAGLSAMVRLSALDSYKDIANKAQQYAGSSAELNKQFSLTGKGLVAVTIDGNSCVIDAPSGVKGAHVNYMACVP